MQVKFGTAGCPDDFYEEGHKHTLEIPKWLHDRGLTAFEVQCGRGVKFSTESAKRLGDAARQYKIALSVHSPYYINISTREADKREKSFGYILETAVFARNSGADRIVVHMGSYAGGTREEALALSKDFMRECLERMDREGLGEIHICPETMGKINQMGTVDEVLDLCRLDPRLIPTLDFGHINARSQGALQTVDDYNAILDQLGEKLDAARLSTFHAHFSKIEYTAGGEKKHLTFDEDNGFGPPFEPLAQVLAERRLSPTIICESRGTQAIDALKMQATMRKFI